MQLEVSCCIDDVDEAIENLERWMAPEEFEPKASPEGSSVRIEYEARGVVLLFGPWNFPFQLVFQPLVPIIAAGNTAIVKPNEMAPATSKVIADVIRDAFGEEDVAVFEGDVELANALLELPVDHIFFTGSPTVGKVIMRAAANHLATVTLELGGKCPVVVDGTADLREAARIVAGEKHYNAGQICLSPDHLWVRTDIKDEFLRYYAEWVDETVYPGGQFSADSMSKMVDARNVGRVQSYIDDAVARGATILRGGGTAPSGDVLDSTVIVDAPLDSRLMREEIFGPVLPVQTFDHVEEFLDYVHHGGKPLAIYVHSTDPAFIRAVLDGTSSGGVTVNGGSAHWAETQLPFGGVNTSGIGAYHGVHGFRELSHAKAVVVRPAESGNPS